jgi:hypothetical protein
MFYKFDRSTDLKSMKKYCPLQFGEMGMTNITIRSINLYIMICLLCFNGCAAIDIAYKTTYINVDLQSDEIEFNKKTEGNIGFCGLYRGDLTNTVSLGSSIQTQNDFLKSCSEYFRNSIYNDRFIDCKSKLYISYYPYATKYYNLSEYYKLFEISENGKSKLYDPVLSALNKDYNCDYYLVGKFSGEYIGSSTFKKGSQFKISLLLVLYNSSGERAGSIVFQKQYDIDPEKPHYDTFLFCSKRLIDEYKDVINKNLSFKK